jgi:hypothetical protein
MSTPLHSANPLHPVRQQLDELDGLLQRMLELPVDPTSETSPTTTAVTSANVVVESPDPATAWPGEETVPQQAGATEANGNPLLLDSPGTGLANPSFSDFQFQFSQPNPSAAVGTGRAVGVNLTHWSPPHVDEWQEEISLWLWPLAAVNRVVDRCLGFLGRPGRWWQGTWGRACVGVMGLLLLAGALAWGILDWMQWTW